MTNERFLELVEDSFCALKDNCVSLPREKAAVPVLDAPLTGFAAADDPIFEQFRDP